MDIVNLMVHSLCVYTVEWNVIMFSFHLLLVVVSFARATRYIGLWCDRDVVIKDEYIILNHR